MSKARVLRLLYSTWGFWDNEEDRKYDDLLNKPVKKE